LISKFPTKNKKLSHVKNTVLKNEITFVKKIVYNTIYLLGNLSTSFLLTQFILESAKIVKNITLLTQKEFDTCFT